MTMTHVITDLYCEGVSDPIPWAGTAHQFIQRRAQAQSDSHPGRIGKIGMEIVWEFDGRKILLDLNHTRVIAMVERWAPAP